MLINVNCLHTNITKAFFNLNDVFCTFWIDGFHRAASLENAIKTVIMNQAL